MLEVGYSWLVDGLFFPFLLFVFALGGYDTIGLLLIWFFLLRSGNLRSLNELAKQARADHIIHTGDFGFYDDTSLDRIADK